MSKTLITYGTFDMFHIGHLNLLRRLKSMAGRVIVAVSTDDFNAVKGKKTMIPYEQRAAIIDALECVDLVIPEETWEQKVTDIKKHNVDIFAIGDDWSGEFDFLSDYCEVVYLPRTKNISTTELKQSLRNFMSTPRDDLIKTFEVLDSLKKDLL